MICFLFYYEQNNIWFVIGTNIVHLMHFPNFEKSITRTRVAKHNRTMNGITNLVCLSNATAIKKKTFNTDFACNTFSWNINKPLKGKSLSDKYSTQNSHDDNFFFCHFLDNIKLFKRFLWIFPRNGFKNEITNKNFSSSFYSPNKCYKIN